MLRIDGHTSDVIDVSPVTRGGWFEQIAHHPFRELTPVTRVLEGRSHLDPGDSTLRRDPEADLVALPVRVARCARARRDRPQRRGGAASTRGAARGRRAAPPPVGARAPPRAAAAAALEQLGSAPQYGDGDRQVRRERKRRGRPLAPALHRQRVGIKQRPSGIGHWTNTYPISESRGTVSCPGVPKRIRIPSGLPALPPPQA